MSKTAEINQKRSGDETSHYLVRKRENVRNTGQSVPNTRHSQTRAKNICGLGDFGNLELLSLEILSYTYERINK